MISIQAVNASELTVSGPETLRSWRETLRFKVPGHQFTQLFKRGRWDGTWAPGKYLRQVAKEPEPRYEWRGSRGHFARLAEQFGLTAVVPIAQQLTPDITDGLRDYQTIALRETLDHNWGRIAYATNAGKGALFGRLARFAVKHAMPCLILCDEVGVFDALMQELKVWGGATVASALRDVSAGASDRPPPARLTLAMVPTLARRLKDEDGADGPWRQWLGQHSMLLLDEADRAGSASWRSIILACQNTLIRIGMSGSFPTDPYEDLKLEELMGPVIASVKNDALVERGVSAKPTITVYGFDATHALRPFPDEEWLPSDLPRTPAALRANAQKRRALVFDRCIVGNTTRHGFVRRLIRPGIPTVVIVTRIDHGEALCREIDGSFFLDGSASPDDRRRALDAFKDGKISCIIVTKILDRGTNRLGWAQDIVFASGEGSSTQTLQRIGRGLRRAGGKETVNLFDIADKLTIRPDCDEILRKRMMKAAGFLRAAVMRRLDVYAEEGFDVELVK